ncbi:heparinase II/III family protein [Kiloniella majae]|uniref:heparinase II/III family protein n=1 Tax=Kiloniella majae TaxID=1938558 RepID=UPI000A277AD6|nr:heparinase II/III family protein [Kiloniella majae]
MVSFGGLRDLFKAAHQLPPHVLIKKISSRLRRDFKSKNRYHRDLKLGSRGPLPKTSEFPSHTNYPAFQISEKTSRALDVLAKNYCDHRFDLLGSGLTDTNAEFSPVNSSNRFESKRIRSLISVNPYRPIDWHADFKSGYRWNSDSHSYDLKIPINQGADIKVPWELARLQHLPQLALAGVQYQDEIRAQVLDFIASNPPRFGVNWICPMDVGIRIANILLSVDLIQSAGQQWDKPFLAEVLRSAQEHSDHILAHLEWSELGRSNHYISNIIGILWANAYLPSSLKRNACLAFCAQQIETEARTQFLDDGGCYEGSSNYHRLSGSLLTYAQALLVKLYNETPECFANYPSNAISVRPPFSPPPITCPDIISILDKAANLSEALTPEDSLPVQIGDSDAGHLFKVEPDGYIFEGSFIEQPLNHQGFIDTVAALHGSVSKRLDAQLISQLVQNNTYPVASSSTTIPYYGDLKELCLDIRKLPEASRRQRVIKVPNLSPFDLKLFAYPQFGSYVFKAPDFFLHFRCAPTRKKEAPTGHFHDDDLSIELISPMCVIRDPGSYLYTPDVEVRNRYRSAEAHDTPRATSWDIAPPTASLFTLPQIGSSSSLTFQPNGVAGKIETVHGTLWRAVIFTDSRITILDGVSAPNTLREMPEPLTYCDNYGRQA